MATGTAQRMVFGDGETLSWRQHNTFLQFYTEGPLLTLDQDLDLTCTRPHSGSVRRSKSVDSISTSSGSPLQSPSGSRTESVKSLLDSPRSGSSSKEIPALESTTLMLRNIACRFSQVDVAEILNEQGLKGTYDFIYLPRSPTRPVNLGYAFVNFTSQESAERAWALLDGVCFGQGRSKSPKLCEVTVAHAQGQGNMAIWKGRKATKRNAPEPLWFDADGEIVSFA